MHALSGLMVVQLSCVSTVLDSCKKIQKGGGGSPNNMSCFISVHTALVMVLNTCGWICQRQMHKLCLFEGGTK